MPRKLLWKSRGTLAALCLSFAGGCASYEPLPLVQTAPLAPDVTSLAAAPAETKSLSVNQIVDLALANNPELKAVRLKRLVAHGQTEQAGILPNPSFSGAVLPLLSGVGTVPAWSLGLSQNLKAFLTYHAHEQAAQNAEKQIDADVVWQEWLVAGQARQIATDLIMNSRSRPIYTNAFDLLSQRSAKLEKEVAAHRISLTTAAPDYAALQTARTALDGVDQKQLSLMHQLDALLGLRSDVVVPLAQDVDLPPFDPQEIRASLPDLPKRRPDLLALRFGYAAADESVREAIQAQFPDLILGGAYNSDNARVINGGPNISLGVPIFDRNQGNVAITTATRAQLHAEYTARLTVSMGEVSAMLSEIEQLQHQLDVARQGLPSAQAAAQYGQTALTANNIDERAYIDLASNCFSKKQEILTLETALLDRQIAIQTLVGAGLPTVDLPSEKVARKVQ